MVKVGLGDTFGDKTAEYLGEVKDAGGVLICVCSETYGEETKSKYCTYHELRYGQSHGMTMWALQEAPAFPPCRAGKKGKAVLDMVFPPDAVFANCQDKSEREVAKLLADELLKSGSSGTSAGRSQADVQ